MIDIAVYFTHSAALVFGALIVLWALSVAIKNASIIDIFWGFGFLIVGAACLWLSRDNRAYQILLCSLPIIWGARLTLYLGKRNIGHGEDKRYVALRKDSHNKSGISEMGWRLRSLLTIYFGQGLLIMIVSAPIWVAMAKYSGQEIGLLALIGAIIWLIGFLFEAIGDWQLSNFIKKNKGYAGPIKDKPVLDSGLWKYTRHPNYFGNACMWWGIWITACQIAPQTPLILVTIIAPIIMTFLLTRVSGRDMLERDMGRRKNYQAYMQRTSSFIPKFPNRS